MSKSQIKTHDAGPNLQWLGQVFKFKLARHFSSLESEIWNMHKLFFVFIVHI